MEIDDQQLISDGLSGDEEAITFLIDRHLKSVFNFIYRLVGKSKDAEDITQETFVKMWRNLKKYRHSDNFKTWLFTIARNTAIDWMRKKKSVAFSDFENEEGENLFTDNLRDPEPLPDEIFAKAEEKNLLREKLDSLSPSHREIIFLYYTEHLTFSEIGAILGKSLNTVKSRHRRALMELRKLLEANAPK